MVESVMSADATALLVARSPKPSEVRPVAASRPVAPPSHLRLSVYAVSQLGPFTLMSYPSTVPVVAMLPETCKGLVGLVRPMPTLPPVM